jgi:two-component system chemotaxis sensor kinase CheA
MDAIVKEFLVESYENLDQLDRDLVQLEEDPCDADRLASIFRTIHTIKGTSGFFGFNRLESLTHVGENLLCKMRDGELRLNPEITTGLLAMVDAVRQILAHVESAGDEGTVDYDELVADLTRLQSGEQPLAATAAAKKPAKSRTTKNGRGRKADGGRNRDPIQAAEESLEAVATGLAQASEAVTDPGSSDARPSLEGDRLDEAGTNKQENRTAGLSDGSIRVDVGLIDKLMNLVGELVLARNQILQFNVVQNDSVFLSTAQRLNLITTELQEGVMKTRMQPIGNVWNKFPRVVRDLAVACGKQVRIEMEGKDTELDKTIIEAIKDPLTHLVRNSVDHGIESPEARQSKGKPIEGRLSLRAFHEGGHVNIEITDDGAGIDTERVKKKALDRGLVTPERLARMSERELLGLIFLPGFSTAEKVSNISGRGVGMDVVKTNIERIGGTVDLQSVLGHGTTIRIKIPLTLAIIPALVITSGGERYAIPQVNLLELVRLDGEHARRGIENIHGAPVYRLRGRLLPLVYLNEQLDIESRASGDTVNIIVLQADDRQFGLVVDGINDTEEIVVKPLGKQLKGNPLFAGATIMGDGRVALILDVVGIAQCANVVSEMRDRQITGDTAAAEDLRSEWQTLLLVGVGRRGRIAIPLSVVSRLEEIRASQIERAAEQQALQYRGQILPLFCLRDLLPSYGCQGEEEVDLLQLVVCSDGRQSVGLVVDRILDIVETKLEITRDSVQQGILSSAVVQGHMTDLLDVSAVISAVEHRTSLTTSK